MGRGGGRLVGPKAQLFPKMRFEGSPYSEFCSCRFDTSRSMVPRLVPEISSLDTFCDTGAGAAAAGVGIGDSRSWNKIALKSGDIVFHFSC